MKMVALAFMVMSVLMLYLIYEVVFDCFSKKKRDMYTKNLLESNGAKSINEDYLLVIGFLFVILFLIYVGLFRNDNTKGVKDENGFTSQQRKMFGIPDVIPPKTKTFPSKKFTNEQLLEMQKDLDKLIRADQEKKDK
jgi:hypothetical protein